MAKKKRPFPYRSHSWDEWYKLAKQYRDTHGDLLVPKNYVCPGGEKLGRWIEGQRARYNEVPSAPRCLYPDEIALLNGLGMVWKLENRWEWSKWLSALDRCRKALGHINVSADFTLDGYALGNWIIRQRKLYANGELTPKQIADLDARGMVWSARPPRRAWDDWFQDAERYHADHGDLMVPQDYCTEDGHRLGLWIYQQRDLYMDRRPNQTLRPDRVARLESIGMVWEPEKQKAEAWESMYGWIADYWRDNGKLPLWPRGQKAPDGRSMSGWIASQRTALAQGGVTQERAARLAEIGIVAARSEASRAEDWERMYASVADYIRQNGRVPASHKALPAPDGRSMSRWIRTQRRSMEKGVMPRERAERLARLGIVGTTP